MPDQPDRRVDELQHRPRRAERGHQRELLERQPALLVGHEVLAAHFFRPAGEIVLGRNEIDRIGALEAEDRLLVIADGEQGACRRRMDTAPDEIFVHQRAHDPPLARIGVLRLVDQHMLGDLVELEAHPFADPRLVEQIDRRGDQVVEIDRPRPPLRRRIAARIVPPHRQRVGEQVGEGGAHAQRQQLRALPVQPHREIGIDRVLRRLPLAERTRIAVRLGPDVVKVIQRRRALLRAEREPRRDRLRPRDAVLRPPCAVERGDRLQRAPVDRIVAAGRADRLLDIAPR